MLGPGGGARSPEAEVGIESLALDVARKTSLAFFVSARERELSFQSCAGKQTKRRCGYALENPMNNLFPAANPFSKPITPQAREGQQARPQFIETV